MIPVSRIIGRRGALGHLFLYKYYCDLQSRTMQPRIYTYKITFEEVPYYYYGVHKEKRYNEEYCGSPVTQKWCWNFYTPKKQILELFEYSDIGWLEAQEVEKRLIKYFYNVDKFCLNKSCGGNISLDIVRKNMELGLGMFGISDERKFEIASKNGKVNSANNIKNKKAIFGLSKEQRVINAKKGGAVGGKISGTNHKIFGTGIFGMSKEEAMKFRIAGANKKFICLETGYISNGAGLSHYQRKRGINISNRKELE